MKNMLWVACLVGLLLVAGTGLRAQEGTAAQVTPEPEAAPVTKTPDPEILNLEEARRSLQFGTSTTVLGVVKQATGKKDARIRDAVVPLVSAINDDIAIAALEYFRTLEDLSVLPDVMTRLENHPDNSGKLNAALLDYVAAKPVEASTALHAVLLEMINAPVKEVQAQAIKVLAGKGSAQDADALVDLFKDTDTSVLVRQAVISALGTLSSPKSIEFLRTILEDDGEDNEIRNLAIAAVGKLGDADSLKLILGFLQSKESVHRRGAAIQALAGYPLDAVRPAYFQALRDDFWRNRQGAIKVIAEKKHPGFLEALCYMAEKDPETPVRIEAIQGLAAFAEAQGQETMKRLLLDDKSPGAIRVRIIELMMKDSLPLVAADLLSLVEKEWANDKSVLVPAIARSLAVLENRSGSDLARKLLSHKDAGVAVSAIRWIQLNKAAEFRADLESLVKKGGAYKSAAEAALKALDKS